MCVPVDALLRCWCVFVPAIRIFFFLPTSAFLCWACAAAILCSFHLLAVHTVQISLCSFSIGNPVMDSKAEGREGSGVPIGTHISKNHCYRTRWVTSPSSGVTCVCSTQVSKKQCAYLCGGGTLESSTGRDKDGVDHGGGKYWSLQTCIILCKSVRGRPCSRPADVG